MALVHTTSADNESATLSAGTLSGHVLVNHANCTLSGAGVGRTIITLDGTYNTAVRAVSNRQSFTLKNCTIDVAGLPFSSVSAPIEVNSVIPIFIAENVEIRGYGRGAMAVDNRGVFRGTGLKLSGLGGALYHYSGATEMTIRGCEIVGGQFGFVNVATSGIDIKGLSGRFHYWASPTYEAVTATGYGSTYADVTSHATSDRSLYDVLRYLSPVTTFDAEGSLRSSLVQLYDRVEVASGVWTQVIGFGPSNTALLDEWRMAGSWRVTGNPSGTATVYRVTLGISIGSTSTRLLIQTNEGQPTSPRWRSVTGATMPTPTAGGGSRLDIIRAGGSNRDTDTGGVHITENSENASITDSSIVGGWSDMITLRGTGTVAERCVTDLGQDMGFTVDGTDGRVTLRRCESRRAGRNGYAMSGGPSDLYSCVASDNGTINDGSTDYGVTTTSACIGSTLQVRGSGNLTGLLGGTITEVSAGGFEPAPRPDRARSRRSKWGHYR